MTVSKVPSHFCALFVRNLVLELVWCFKNRYIWLVTAFVFKAHCHSRPYLQNFQSYFIL